MHPRLAAMATLGREIAMPASVLVCLAAFGSADIGNTGASVAERVAPPPTTDTALVIRPPAIAFAAADVGAVSRKVTEMVTEEPAKAPVEPEPDPIVTAALTNSPEVLPAEAQPSRQMKRAWRLWSLGTLIAPLVRPPPVRLTFAISVQLKRSASTVISGSFTSVRPRKTPSGSRKRGKSPSNEKAGW